MFEERKRHISAIGRSLDVYYRDTERTQRMDSLNAMFVPKGGLAFDIGAHVGDRTGSFLRLGASVVALEPQPRVFRALRFIHSRTPGATLMCQAVGASPGTLELHVNEANPTTTTASQALIHAAGSSPQWDGQVWGSTLQVPVTTLDALIERYGTPDFVKIDVEGHELDVLNGLSTPLPALSFEFTTIQRDVALACIERLAGLGRFTFNLSLGEDHKLKHPAWTDPYVMRAEILALPVEANSGDIFARLS